MQIILFQDLNSSDKRAVVVIGNGLVGSAISEGFIKKLHNQNYNCCIDWNNAENAAQNIKENVVKYISDDVKTVDWIWSAGKVGFDAAEEDIQKEFQLFEKCSLMILSLHNINYTTNFIISLY